MKIKDYIKDLQKWAEKYPNAEVVYAADDEGNSYHSVNWTGTPGMFHDDSFYQDDDKDYFEESTEEKFEINAICIN